MKAVRSAFSLGFVGFWTIGSSGMAAFRPIGPCLGGLCSLVGDIWSLGSVCFRGHGPWPPRCMFLAADFPAVGASVEEDTGFVVGWSSRRWTRDRLNRVCAPRPLHARI